MKNSRHIIYVTEALMIASLCGLIVVFECGFSVWTTVLKTLASVFFVITGCAGYGMGKGKEDNEGKEAGRNRFYQKMMITALVCSMAGDVLLALDKNEGIMFVLGVAGFAAAHILFSVAFSSLSSVGIMDIAGAVAVFGVLLSVLYFGTFDFKGLFPVIVGYAAVISFMVTKALTLWKRRKGMEKRVRMVMAGGLLFLVSDSVLLFWLFGIGTPKEVQSVNWALYYIAQGCLAYSVCESDNPQGQI